MWNDVNCLKFKLWGKKKKKLLLFYLNIFRIVRSTFFAIDRNLMLYKNRYLVEILCFFKFLILFDMSSKTWYINSLKELFDKFNICILKLTHCDVLKGHSDF